MCLRKIAIHLHMFRESQHRQPQLFRLFHMSGNHARTVGRNAGVGVAVHWQHTHSLLYTKKAFAAKWDESLRVTTQIQKC